MVADQAMAENALPRHRWWLIIAGLIIVLAGGALAQFILTADGTTVRDIRFTGTNGTVMSALLYVPKNATSTSPSPGILAVGGQGMRKWLCPCALTVSPAPMHAGLRKLVVGNDLGHPLPR